MTFESVVNVLGLVSERASSRISRTSSAGKFRKGVGRDTRDKENLRLRVWESVVVIVAIEKDGVSGRVYGWPSSIK